MRRMTLLSRKLLVKFRLLALILPALFVFSLTPTVWAEATGEIEWVRQFGGVGPAFDSAAAVAAEGSVYVAGRTSGTLPGQTSAGVTDAFVRKYDADGNEV